MSKYYYDGTKCVLCSALSGSTPASSAGNICVCKPTLTWDSVKLDCLCAGVNTGTACIPCVANIGASALNTADTTKCVCIGQLTWNPILKQCGCGTNQIITYEGNCVTCATTLDANIVGVNDRYNCKCADPFFWDNIQNKCIKCGTGGLANSNGKTMGL